MGSPRPNESRNAPYIKGVEEKLSAASYVDTTTAGSRFRYSRTWSGTRTPNFGKLKSGQLPVNNHTVSIRDVPVDVMGYLRQDPFTGFDFNWYTARVGAYSEIYPTGPDSVGNIEDAADNRAIQKMIEKIGSGIEGNLAQDIAQWGQTTGLIANAARAIASSIKNVRRGNFPAAIDALRSASSQKFRNSFSKGSSPSWTKSVAENWLALQYGWKPLLKDVEASLDSLGNAVANSALGNRVIHQVTASASASGEKKSKINLSGYPIEAGVKTTTVKTSKRYGIRYVVDNPTLAFLQQTGFTNPINLGWEILPFSFVIDWFLPVGKYLESFTYAQGLTFLDGYKVTFTRTRVLSAVAYSNRIPGSNVIHTEAANYLEDRVDYQRSRISTFPVMSAPTLKTGIDNSKGGIAHALNAIALMGAQFR